MKTSIILTAFLVLSAVMKAQPPAASLPMLGLQEYAHGFQYPIDLANCGDSRLFVVERLGKVWFLDSMGNKSAEPFLDITDKVFTVFPYDYDERGLLGLTFHPNYPDSPYLYVNYIGHDSNSHVSRFTMDPTNPNKALESSEVIFLTVNQPKLPDYVNHKGGCIKFGPVDGYLYSAFGDGGSADDPMNNAQNPHLLLGKMIRIDVDHPDAVNGTNYSIPPTNPFINSTRFKPEIWATGLRNPYRWSFDSKSGGLWLADVGQDLWEEINLLSNVKGGKNFGWSCYEANHNFKIDSCDYNGTPYTFPIVEYKHGYPCASIIGGYVYRGTRFKKMWSKYFYCDYCTGRFSTVLKYNNTYLNLYLNTRDQSAYVGFGEDSRHELYVVNTNIGTVYHLVDSSDLAPVKPGIANQSNAIEESLDVKISPNPNHGQFNIEFTAVQDEAYKISITNLFGTEVINETRFANKGFNHWSFASSKLQKNIYVLHVQTSKGTVSKKFVVE